MTKTSYGSKALGWNRISGCALTDTSGAARERPNPGLEGVQVTPQPVLVQLQGPADRGRAGTAERPLLPRRADVATASAAPASTAPASTAPASAAPASAALLPAQPTQGSVQPAPLTEKQQPKNVREASPKQTRVLKHSRSLNEPRSALEGVKGRYREEHTLWVKLGLPMPTDSCSCSGRRVPPRAGAAG